MQVDTITAIEQVINNRIKNGASKEGLRAYINHLLTETKNKPYTCEAIKELATKYDLS